VAISSTAKAARIERRFFIEPPSNRKALERRRGTANYFSGPSSSDLLYLLTLAKMSTGDAKLRAEL
jgi:hypothetical protein